MNMFIGSPTRIEAQRERADGWPNLPKNFPFKRENRLGARQAQLTFH